MSAEALHARLAAALTHHRSGRLAAARDAYAAILADHPHSFDALHLLGILEAEAGAVDRGIGLIRGALAVDASRSQAHYSLATALIKKGDAPAALSSLERALTLQPGFVEAWFARGNVLQQAERWQEAAANYRRALELRPAFPEAFNNLAAAERALRQLARAEDSANRALSLQPAYAKAFNNRGLIRLDGGRTAAAVEDFRRAVEIDARFAEAWHNLGTALMQLRRCAQARDAFAQLITVAPDFPHAPGNIVFAKLCCCDWTGIEAAAESVRAAVARGAHAALPASFLSYCGSAALQLRCAKLYTQAYFSPRAMPMPAAAGEGRAQSGDALSAEHARLAPACRRHDKIRVAYLSGDFGEHAVTYLLASVFERHDANRFDTIALAWDRRATTPARRRMEAAFSHFIDVTDQSDADVAQLMRDLEVDIAVDLMGHTLGQRTGILARRPAPIQVNYLGLPASMGAPYVDYLIADPFVVPPDQSIHYAERLVWLPGSFQPNDDARILPQPSGPRSAYGLPSPALVFCCFNRNHKILPSCFDVWMQLLARVPDSVLWLLATEPTTADSLRHEARRRSIDGARLIFADEEPYEAYLARYVHADLFLDTAPFNGGATVSDAVSMGVPVLTCAGESFASRMAGSILNALGLPQLVTHSLEEYAERAIELATDRAHLTQLRRRLAERRSACGFFDTDRYRRNLESAYTAMWERHERGEAPSALRVPLT